MDDQIQIIKDRYLKDLINPSPKMTIAVCGAWPGLVLTQLSNFCSITMSVAPNGHLIIHFWSPPSPLHDLHLSNIAPPEWLVPSVRVCGLVISVLSEDSFHIISTIWIAAKTGADISRPTHRQSYPTNPFLTVRMRQIRQEKCRELFWSILFHINIHLPWRYHHNLNWFNKNKHERSWVQYFIISRNKCSSRYVTW